MADQTAEASALLFAQAQRQLDRQLADLDALRTRAVAALSVSTLAAGLFATRIPPPGPATPRHTTVGLWVALTAFAVGVLLALLITLPRRGWVFTFRLDHMLDRVEQSTLIPLDVTHNLTRWSEEARRWNSVRLDRLTVLFAILCLLIGVQVIAWGVAIS